MTHRDGFPRLSARSAWRSDAGHRKPRAPSQSHGPPESLGQPPFRSRRRTAGGRRKALPMSRIARGFPPTRRIACPISMGHYQRSLVLWPRTPCPGTRRLYMARHHGAATIPVNWESPSRRRTRAGRPRTPKQIFETPRDPAVSAGFAKSAGLLRACSVILARPFVAGSGTL